MKGPIANLQSDKRKGFALLFVVFGLALIIVMSLAFLSGMRTETKASSSYSKGVFVRLLADASTEIVKDQIRKATLEADTVWASQPGALRTYDTAGSASKVYKLYSSRNLIETSSFNAGTASNPTEVPTDWKSRPHEYADLNTPVKKIVNGTEEAVYPILNPNAYNSDPSKSVQGFSIDNASFNISAASSPGGVAELPMPVSWLYQLQDGSITSMDPVTKKISNATKSNPVVGRLAFWSDDETAKLNINTSGDGVFWDIPRGDSTKTLAPHLKNGSSLFDTDNEKAFIAYAPIQHEYQRYPGHPFQLSLKTIFPTLTSEQIYALTPRVQSDNLGSNLSDSNKSNWRDWQDNFPDSGMAQLGGVAPLTLKTDRLYASLDELLFKPTLSGTSRAPNTPITTITPEILNKTRFFLTAYNRAPELNLFNKPRISMWPVPNQNNRRSPIDKWFARCSTIGGKAFYFTREQSQNPTFDYSNITRNSELYNYLQKMTSEPVPGYGGNFSTKFGNDRDQILTEIFDYIRCTNLADLSNTSSSSPNIIYAASRDIPPSELKASTEASLNFFGFGQVVPIRIGSTRGFGRFDTISEITILFYAMQWDATRHVRSGEGYPTTWDGTDVGSPSPVTGISANTPLYRAMILLEPFNPSQGYVASVPDYQITINGLDTIQVNNANIGFQASATNTIRGAFGTGGTAGGATGSVWVGTTLAPFDGWTGGQAGKDGQSGRILYPFISAPFPISGPVSGGVQTSNPTFLFNGSSNITIEIKNKDGQLIQTLNARFPSATLPTPTLDSGSPTGAQIHKRIRTASNITLNLIEPSDVVVSLEPAGNAVDLRWLKIQSNAAVASFSAHQNYSTPTGASGNAKGANSLRRSLRASFANSSATFGNLIPNLRNGAPADIPSSVNGVFNAQGDPGDWDTGFGDSRDGPYINKPDEVNTKYKANNVAMLPYFSGSFSEQSNVGFDTFFAPNRMVPSPGMLGSLSSRLQANGPWETLLFNPNPAAGDAHRGFGSDKPNGSNPPDYLWMDLFTMPIVEPYAISEPFSTAGKVNLNYQIVPFTYITRSTALQAVLGANRVTAIHDGDGFNPASPPTFPTRKMKNPGGSYNPISPNYNNTNIRHLINIPETLKQFTARFDANNLFRTAAEICSLDLYPIVTSANMPKLDTASAARMPADQPSYQANRSSIKTWWSNRRLTGDNVREQPYTTMYQNVTTQSNSYTVHVRAQTIQKSPLSPPDEMTAKDAITGEYRGSTLIERYLNADDPAFTSIDFAANSSPGLASYYKFRTIEQKQFLP